MAQETIEKTFAVASPARLDLSNIRGSVEIRPGEDDLFQVTAVKQTDSGDAGKTQIEISQAANRNVTVATHFPDGWWLWILGSKPCRVDYIVKMPRNSTLKVRGVSNTVLVDGFSGDFDFQTVSGNLTLKNLTGPVQINTVSGDVSAAKLSGAFELVTVSGDLEASDGQLTSIRAKTVSGHLTVQTLLSEGPYHFDSVSGDLRLQVPAEARFSARLSSISGGISSAFPTTNFTRGHGSQKVEIQGGGITILASSVSGNLRLQPFGDAPCLASTDRREILGRIERGEMTPAEALVQLKA
jgi:hypothetical protein